MYELLAQLGSRQGWLDKGSVVQDGVIRQEIEQGGGSVDKPFRYPMFVPSGFCFPGSLSGPLVEVLGSSTGCFPGPPGPLSEVFVCCCSAGSAARVFSSGFFPGPGSGPPWEVFVFPCGVLCGSGSVSAAAGCFPGPSGPLAEVLSTSGCFPGLPGSGPLEEVFD